MKLTKPPCLVFRWQQFQHLKHVSDTSFCYVPGLFPLLGSDVSLLERLTRRCSVYHRRPDPETGVYNPLFITKLVQNYRSHPAILEIPNELFYRKELMAYADIMARQSLCRWNGLPKQDFPMIFHGVVGQDQREERSPSFFNPQVSLLLGSCKRKERGKSWTFQCRLPAFHEQKRDIFWLLSIL